MHISLFNPKDFFNPFYYNKEIKVDELLGFVKALKKYKQDLGEAQAIDAGERHIVAQTLKPFLESLNFETKIEQNQEGAAKNSAIDLAIFGCKNESVKNEMQIEVIFEAKDSAQNKGNFPSLINNHTANASCKALYETILYYFRERELGNNSLKFIILCDFYHFYFIRSSEFESLFYQNKIIRHFYTNFTDKDSLFKGNTKEFYQELSKILDSDKYKNSFKKQSLFEREENGDYSYAPHLKALHLDLSPLLQGEILNAHIDENFINDNFTTLKPLFKAFHSDFLLGNFNPNDANSLSDKFYKELLYILGLCERDEKGKTIKEKSQGARFIKESQESLEHKGTLFYATQKVLQNKFPDEPHKSDFESTLSLMILWLNRMLFLKLIEANLVRFNGGNKTLKFLNFHKIPTFSTLNTLFFEVLAKKDRDNGGFSYLPYLNSSLFNRNEKEKALCEISALDDTLTLAYFEKTSLRDKNCKPLKGENKLLAYLFKFLDAFDFGAQESESELSAQKDLINSSVLGLVFEKLNGYKEGSFYTPSFITSYMCEESLHRVVVEKFNAKFKEWNVRNIEELAEEIHGQIRKDRTNKEVFKSQCKDILQSVRICDPAVGSGHFLVSALNTMISIYDTLGLFENYFFIELENDELRVRDRLDNLIEYQRPNNENEAHKVQMELFELKKSIIENNLFGVDINPNSCEITKLRLWIELLKHSYYLNYTTSHDSKIHRLETLPNIDINIKCGNSLISRFSLQDTLKTIPNIARQINDYKDLVKDYKEPQNAKFHISKDEIYSKIESIKRTFSLTLKDPKTKKELDKAIKNHIVQYGNFLLDNESLLDALSLGHSNLFNDEVVQQLTKKQEAEASVSFGKITLLRNKLNLALSGKEYKDAFEWRFEFPEVLDSNGDFLGFDLVIGNPPYIDYRDINKNTLNKTKHYTINKDSNRPNIFCYFIERGIDVLTQNGILAFINPIAMLQANFAYGTRKLLLEKGCIDYIVDCSYIKVFDSASTYTMMWGFSKNKPQNCANVMVWQDNEFKYSHSIKSYLDNEHFIINISKNKINFKKNDYTALEELGTLKCGTSQSGYGKKKITLEDFSKLNRVKQKDYKPIIQTADIKRYFIDWQEEYIPIEIYSQSIQSDFNKPKIVIARMTKKIQASFDVNKFYMGKATLIVDLKLNPCYILGILNSKLASFWYLYHFETTHLASGYLRYDIPYLKQLPIPKITKANQNIVDRIITLVDEILNLKAKDSATNTNDLEAQIDTLVYKLYSLTNDEIQKIETHN